MTEKNALVLRIGMTAIMTVWMAGSAMAADRISVGNSLHMEYDDNIAQSKTDKIDSVKVTNQISLTLAYPGEVSGVNARYHMIASWWEARKSNEWTFDHLVDFDWSRKLTPQLGLNVTDRFVRRDNSELIDEDGRTVVGESSYLYNSLSGAVNVGVTAQTLAVVSGRWQLLRYEDEGQAEREDYDIYAGGITLRNQYRRDAVLLGELRYEKTSYVDGGKTVDYSPVLPGAEGKGRRQIPDRSHSAIMGGVGLEQNFSPNLIGRASVGYMLKEFDAANTDNESAPYADAAVTIASDPRTRLTLGASYSLYQSSLLSFSTQRRTAFSASLGRDLTGQLSLYLAGTYVNSDYQAKTSVDTVRESEVREGSEDAVALSARAVYWVDRPRKNAIEAGWTFTDLNSDLRSDYTRNRYDVAWRIQL